MENPSSATNELHDLGHALFLEGWCRQQSLGQSRWNAGPGAALPASSPLAQSALYRRPATPGPQMLSALHRCQSSYSSPVSNSPRAVQRWFS